MRRLITFAVASFIGLAGLVVEAPAQNQKPDSRVIRGDAIGTTNISINNRGLVGSPTPHIDRIAREGISHADHYRQQSFTAGNAPAISFRTEGLI